MHSERGHEITFSTEGTGPSTGIVEGTISCDGTSVHLRHPVHVLNRIPVDSNFEATIHPQSSTNLEIPISSYGDESQRFSVSIDGPLARVATGESSLLVTEDAAYYLVIEPNGLLSENMLVYGTLAISNEDGMSWTIDIELEATSTVDDWWASWTKPGRVIGFMLSILGLSALTGVIKSARATPNIEENQGPETVPQEDVDPWGRPLDEHSSTDAFDVQK